MIRLRPRQKRLVLTLSFLPALLLYMGAVLWVFDRLPEHWAIYTVFFAVVGTVWAFPLKPVFAWMHRDPYAEPEEA